MTVLSTWVLVSGIHFILQFIAWSYTSGNTATISETQNVFQRIGWPILSFPTFWLLPQSFTTDFFWGALVTNSTIWGGVFIGAGTYLVGQQMKQTKS